MKTGYKVVRYDPIRNRWVSATDCAYLTKYIKNKFVKPRVNDGPLGVFTMYGDAIKFMNIFKLFSRVRVKFAVFECEYKPSNNTHFWYENRDGIRIPQFQHHKNCDYASSVKITNKLTIME